MADDTRDHPQPTSRRRSASKRSTSKRSTPKQHQPPPTPPADTPPPPTPPSGNAPTTPPSKRPVLTIFDLQTKRYGEPPQLTNQGHHGSIAYYESMRGDPLVFVYDADRSEAQLYVGYLGWIPFEVRNGGVDNPAIDLFEDESAWLQLCWMAATVTPTSGDEFLFSKLWEEYDVDNAFAEHLGKVVDADGPDTGGAPTGGAPANGGASPSSGTDDEHDPLSPDEE